MRRTSFSDMSCPIARSLDLIGEWWTLLIVREAFWGAKRFGEFEANLGIAPNVLTQRLTKLVDGGVLAVTASSQSGKALEYTLTDKGRDLLPVLVTLAQWGAQHESPPEGAAVQIVERRTGEPIAPVTLRSARGRVLKGSDIAAVPGPGAGPDDQARFEAIQARRRQKAEKKAISST